MKLLQAWVVAVLSALLPAWAVAAEPNLALAQNSPSAAAASEAARTPVLAPLPKLTVRVLDPEGSPVAGAHVGIGASFGGQEQPKKSDNVDADGYVYGLHRLTDSRGEATLESAGTDIRQLLEDQGIYARHDKRHLVAIVQPDPAKLKATLDVTIFPECRVSGKVMCPELKKDKRPLGPTTVSLGDNDHVTLTYLADGSGDYHFFVPAGRYLLDARGPNIFGVVAGIAVPLREHDMLFEPMNAPAGKLSLLEGQPAPELRGAVAWKNGPAPTIAGLKGKCILLFFWRPSAKDSLESVPGILDVYDKLKKYGLEVIGIVADGTPEQKPIDNAKTLDEMLAKVRKDSWGGRDIPFPVAIVAPKPTSFGPSFRTFEWADSDAAADYGVTEYPTVVLIDRHGDVVGALDDSERSVTLLEKTMGVKPVASAVAAPTTPPAPSKSAAPAKSATESKPAPESKSAPVAPAAAKAVAPSH
jgi:hypothetical protein